MGDRDADHHFGIDYQRGRGLVVTICIARATPPYHRPGVALRRCDLSALRARSQNRLSRAHYRPDAAVWFQTLEQEQWENILVGMRLLPWVVYAALWIVADGLAKRAEDDDGGVGDGLVHGVGGVALTPVGRAVMDWLSPNR